MGIPFTMSMGFLLTATMGNLFTMTLGIQLTVSTPANAGLGVRHSVGRGGASGIVSVRCGDSSRLPGPDSMGGVRVSVPESLNHRLMLRPTMPLSPPAPSSVHRPDADRERTLGSDR